MNPVEVDGIRIVVLDRPIHDREIRVICAGLGAYDGESFSIESMDGNSTRLDERTLAATEMPLTGRWKEKYPGYDWYLVTPKQSKAEEGAGGRRD